MGCMLYVGNTQGPVRFVESSGTVHINVIGARNLDLDDEDDISYVLQATYCHPGFPTDSTALDSWLGT